MPTTHSARARLRSPHEKEMNGFFIKCTYQHDINTASVYAHACGRTARTHHRTCHTRRVSYTRKFTGPRLNHALILVLRLLMAGQSAAMRERLAAYITAIWFRLCMCPHVRSEGNGLIEGLLARLADVGFLPSVCPQVHSQIAEFLERHAVSQTCGQTLTCCWFLC